MVETPEPLLCLYSFQKDCYSWGEIRDKEQYLELGLCFVIPRDDEIQNTVEGDD